MSVLEGRGVLKHSNSLKKCLKDDLTEETFNTHKLQAG